MLTKIPGVSNLRGVSHQPFEIGSDQVVNSPSLFSLMQKVCESRSLHERSVALDAFGNYFVERRIGIQHPGAMFGHLCMRVTQRFQICESLVQQGLYVCTFRERDDLVRCNYQNRLAIKY